MRRVRSFRPPALASGSHLIHACCVSTDLIDPAELDAFDAWLAEHLDDLVRRHPGKVVAVYHDDVVAVGDSYREVLAAAAARGIAEPLTLRVPTAEEANAVLLDNWSPEAALRLRLNDRGLGPNSPWIRGPRTQSCETIAVAHVTTACANSTAASKSSVTTGSLGPGYRAATA